MQLSAVSLGMLRSPHMSIRALLAPELALLRGHTSPTPLRTSITTAAGQVFHFDFTAVDTMSCAFTQLEVAIPGLQSAGFAAIRQWADNLTQRLTYLLEQLGPLEFDPVTGQALIRSTPPQQLPDGTQYFEILLQQNAQGNFTLRRYRATKGQLHRDLVEIFLTHEVLYKLCDDLLDSLPTP